MFAIFLSAVFLGLAVAAPVGPTSTAAIRRGLAGGWTQTFWMGQGAAATDFCYILATWLGLTPLLARFSVLPLVLYGAGALMLGWMALGAIREAVRGGAPIPNAGRETGEAGPWYRAFGLGFGVTVVNPATITSWLTLGGAFLSANVAGRSIPQSLLLMSGIWLGSALWFTILAAIVGLARAAIGRIPWLFRAIGAGSGLVLLGFALTFAWKLGLSLLAN